MAILFASPAFAAKNDASNTSTDAVGAGSGAAADENASDQAGAGDIVVTAQHRQERLQDVPSAVTALSKELFRTDDVGKGPPPTS